MCVGTETRMPADLLIGYPLVTKAWSRGRGLRTLFKREPQSPLLDETLPPTGAG